MKVELVDSREIGELKHKVANLRVEVDGVVATRRYLQDQISRLSTQLDDVLHRTTYGKCPYCHKELK